MATRGKFTLKPSALSQHTANFNKILEQVPAPKIESIELVKPAEIVIAAEPISQKEAVVNNQENKHEVEGDNKPFIFGEKLTDRVVNADKTETDVATPTEEAVEQKPVAPLWTGHGEAEEKFDNDLYTIMRLNCKLYVLESDKANWAERGYGVLKLIDTPDGSNCKIMMWTDKCFRLILNTKLFDKMQIDRANKKSIRFNAFDNGTIRIFLIKTANPNDCDELCDTLQMRLNEYTSKLSTSQANEETSKANKNVVFKCDCNLYKENDEQSRSASLELYSFTDPANASRSHQLFLDIVNKHTQEDIYLSTYLKLIKIVKQISKTNESFEFEIDDFSYSAESQKHKFRVTLSDKENETQIMDLYKKEPKLRMDDSSNGGFDRDEDETQEEEDTSYNDESNEANRKSDSLNESDRSDSSVSSSEVESEKPNVFDQETGETKRKRRAESDDEQEAVFKKQEIEPEGEAAAAGGGGGEEEAKPESSHKRSAEENEDNEDNDASKKTKVDEN